jgi:hypothetical protein
MTKKDKVLIDGLMRISQDLADIAAALGSPEAKAKKPEEPVREPTPAPVPAPAAEPAKAVTREELRAFLAEKARTGFRAEVKALLAAYGVEKLSEVDDPDTLAVMMEEAEGIGHG